MDTFYLHFSAIGSQFLTQILATIGAIYLFGFGISLCNALFFKNMGRHAMRAAVITGFIGTPIHESAHALFCLLFGHKIDEICFFQPNHRNGCLGYVSHTWNRRNIYQRIGNFFIGIAPIILITAILFFLARWLVPDMVSDIFATASATSLTDASTNLFTMLWSTVLTFFAAANSWKWWVFLLIALFLVLHMELSPQDMDGAWTGLIMILVLIAIADTVLYFVSVPALNVFTSWFVLAGSFIIGFMTLALIISMTIALLSLFCRLLWQ